MKRLINGLMPVVLASALQAYAAGEGDLSELTASSSAATTEWSVVKADKRHNITTYYKREDNKRFRSFKAEAIYEASFEAAACHQLDVENYPRWYMNIEQSRILKRVSDTEFYMYLKLKAPLGVPPRDVPLHVVITPYSAKTGALTISYSAVADYLPVNPGIVRMAVYEVGTRIAPVETGKVREETEGYAEPGGAAPVWLVNYLQRQMPYANMLARSRDIPRYENGKMPCLFKYKEKD